VSLVRVVDLASSEPAPLVPACAVCAREWSRANYDLPAIVPVKRALIHRAANGRYLAVVHCHGQTETVDLGEEMPSDDRIRTTKAFAFQVFSDVFADLVRDTGLDKLRVTRMTFAGTPREVSGRVIKASAHARGAGR